MAQISIPKKKTEAVQDHTAVDLSRITIAKQYRLAVPVDFPHHQKTWREALANDTTLTKYPPGTPRRRERWPMLYCHPSNLNLQVHPAANATKINNNSLGCLIAIRMPDAEFNALMAKLPRQIKMSELVSLFGGHDL